METLTTETKKPKHFDSGFLIWIDAAGQDTGSTRDLMSQIILVCFRCKKLVISNEPFLIGTTRPARYTGATSDLMSQIALVCFRCEKAHHF